MVECQVSEIWMLEPLDFGVFQILVFQISGYYCIKLSNHKGDTKRMFFFRMSMHTQLALPAFTTALAIQNQDLDLP